MKQSLHSARLRYRPLAEGDVDSFLALVADEHLKRYLFDGAVMERDWCEEAVATSRRMFEELGLGLWLIHDETSDAAVGFCGFWGFEDLSSEPQLLYAFTADRVGRGYATEAGEAMLDAARAAGRTEVTAAVDEPNQDSVRVLEKLGFEADGTAPGAFGTTLLFRRSI